MQQRTRRVKRCIECPPEFVCFMPFGKSKKDLEKDPIILLVEEYEAIRLSDMEGLSMQDGAKKMGVSAPTFNRMVQSAHKKLAEFIVSGKGLKVFEKMEK